MRQISIFLLLLGLCGCPFGSGEKSDGTKKGRDVYFIGVDISGSFMRSRHFNDSLRFLAHYIYTHLNGLGGAKVPGQLFVGPIGGAKAEEVKTLYPIQTFRHKPINKIHAELKSIFPRKRENPYTDYDAFFEQIAVQVRQRKLTLKPITIVMLSDGVPDAPKKNGKHDYRSIKLKALENLARDITLRVLYTSAVVGKNWQTKVPRQRVKVWTQDASVMRKWRDPYVFLKKKKFKDQTRFFEWIKENVDIKVPRKRVD